MNIIKKNLITALMTLASLSAIADSTSTNVVISGTVLPGCDFTQSQYIGDFGIIPGATVGRTVTNLTFSCTKDVPYTLYVNTGYDPYDMNPKAYISNTYVGATYSDGVNGVGTGNLQAVPLYLELQGGSATGTLINGKRVIIKKMNYSRTIGVQINF